jgi:hypothetical protein
MTEWTLGLMKARGMALEAYCPNPSCRRFYAFDLDLLIDEAGVDFRIADIPPKSCGHCGAPLDIRLAMSGPELES